MDKVEIKDVAGLTIGFFGMLTAYGIDKVAFVSVFKGIFNFKKYFNNFYDFDVFI